MPCYFCSTQYFASFTSEVNVGCRDRYIKKKITVTSPRRIWFRHPVCWRKDNLLLFPLTFCAAINRFPPTINQITPAGQGWPEGDRFWIPETPFIAPETFKILIQNLTFPPNDHFLDPWNSIYRSWNVQNLDPETQKWSSPCCGSGQTDRHDMTHALTHKLFWTPTQ